MIKEADPDCIRKSIYFYEIRIGMTTYL
jgi:hypothetical protein